MNPPKIKALIADWDDTITTKDTIELVAEAAYLTNPNFPLEWSYFYNNYYNQFEIFTKQFGPREDLETERKFQKSLKLIELNSIKEIIRLKLFQNVKYETLESQFYKVKIKDNFFKIFQKLYELKIPVIILSCNWTSIIMIKIFQNQGFYLNDHFQIITNEFIQKKGKLTGDFSNDKCIRTGIDKVKHVNDIKLELLNKHGISDGLFYIGDSCTDVLPMLEVNYGLIIGNGSAKSTMEKLGIKFDLGLFGNNKIKCIENWKELDSLI